MPAQGTFKDLWKHMDAPGSSPHTQGLPGMGALLCSPYARGCYSQGTRRSCLIPTWLLSIKKSENSN